MQEYIDIAIEILFLLFLIFALFAGIYALFLLYRYNSNYEENMYNFGATQEIEDAVEVYIKELDIVKEQNLETLNLLKQLIKNNEEEN